MRYLVCYDIAQPRRLRRVARILERHALRCQKSVFLFRGTVRELDDVLAETGRVIDVDEDLVQAWRLACDQPHEGRARGRVTPLFPASLVYDGGQTILASSDIEDDQE